MSKIIVSIAQNNRIFSPAVVGMIYLSKQHSALAVANTRMLTLKLGTLNPNLKRRKIMNSYLIGFIVYGLCLVGLGWWGSKRIKVSEDFMVAGRSMPMFILAFTFAGLWFGGGTVVGAAGVVLDLGIWSTEFAWGVIPDPYGAGLCLILAGLFYFSTLRKVGGVTLSDFFARRFGPKSGIVAAVIMLFGWIFFIAGEIAVIGKIFNFTLGWNYELSIIIAMIIIVLYTIAGGLWSIGVAHTMQMIIILAGITIALPLSLNAAGGFAEIRAIIPAEMISFFPTPVDGFSAVARWLPWIAGWMIIGLGSIPSPDIVQAAQAGKTDREVKVAAIGAGLIYWIFGTFVVIIGLAGFTLIEKGILLEGALLGDPELIIPLMLTELFPLPAAILLIGAIVSGVMSCADGGILSISTLFTKNVIKDVINPDISDKDLLKWGRIVIFLFAVLVVLVSIGYPFVFLLIVFGFDLLLAGLFIPLTLGIYWKKANEFGCIAGIAAGIFVRVLLAGLLEGWAFETVMYPEQWYIYTLAAPLVNLVAIVIVSLLTQKLNKPIAVFDNLK